MGLEQLTVHNFLAITDASLKLDKKINIFSGLNAQGKTSIACALEYLFTGNTRGLEFKKDAPVLIHDGAKQAEIVASFDANTTIRRTRTSSNETLRYISNGTEARELPTHLKYPAIALNPLIYFTDMDVEARRRALFNLLVGAQMRPEELVSRLGQYKAVPETLAKFYAELIVKVGFERAQKDAVEQRRKAKRDLEEWQIDAPVQSAIIGGRSFDLSTIVADEVKEQILSVQGERDKVLTDKGALQAPGQGPTREAVERELAKAKEAFAALKSRPDGSEDDFKRQIERAEKKIEAQERIIREREASIKVTESEARLTIPKLDFVECPVMVATNCPVPMDDRRKLTKMYEDRQKRAQGIIAEMSRDIAHAKHNIVENRNAIKDLREQIEAVFTYERDFASHSAAIRALEHTLSNLPEPQEPGPTRDFDGEIAALDKRLALGHELLRAVEKFHETKAKFEKAGTAAKDAQARIEAYDRIDGALEPSGIRSAMMTDGMKLLNDRLAFAGTALGAQITLSEADLLPAFNRRPYQLCSRSEQWRLQLAMEDAIAFLGKCPYLVVDEASVLDYDLRRAFGGFLMGVKDDYEKIFVFVTDTDHPQQPVDSADIQFWKVESGKVKPV